MRRAAVILRRELQAYFVSPVAYGLAAAFLLIGGYFFWVLLVETQLAEMGYTFGSLAVTLLFVTPMLTLRLLAEERRSGTDELLLTSPASVTEIVLGKFGAAMVVYLGMLALTLVYPLILSLFGSPDPGPVFTGYVGMVLLGAAFIAVGLFASAITSSPVVAGLIALAILLLSWLLGWVALWLPGWAGQVVSALALIDRQIDFQQGVLDSSHVLFFITFTAVFLFLTVLAVDRRRWS